MIKRPRPLAKISYGNAPVLAFECDGLTVEGYSRAGIQTYWRIPEWKLLLDHGSHPWEFASAPRLALTHFHTDHAAGLSAYLGSRNMLALGPPTVYFPASYEERLKDFLAAWHRLSGDAIQCRLVPCRAGEPVPLGQRRMLVPFRNVHTVPSLGYLVVEQRTKLKPELAHLPEKELRERRLAGEEITDIVEIPQLAYCGDTTAATLDLNPMLYEARVLLLEMSFIGDKPGRGEAVRYGHVHLDDVIARADRFRNEHIVFAHFSHRYDEMAWLTTLERELPPGIASRAVAWI